MSIQKKPAKKSQAGQGKPELTFVIPCYNESKNIPLLLEKLSTVVPAGVHIILVDNGSQDDTAKVLKKLLPKYKFATSVKVDINQGYGFGILTGLKAAKGEYIGWTHADLQTDPHDLIKAMNLILAEKSDTPIFIKGLRQGRPLFDKIFTWGMGFFETIYLRTPLWDINAQPTVFHRSLYDNWKNPPHDFSLDLYAMYTAKRSSLKILRFPVLFPERLHGVSSWNTGLRSKWKFIKRTLDFSFKLKKTL